MSSPPRLTAHDRAMRRDRIFARLLDGQSAAAVAAEEGLTPRRVRQMVREALDRWDANPAPAASAAVAERPVATQEIAAATEITPLPIENPPPPQISATFVTHFSRA